MSKLDYVKHSFLDFDRHHGYGLSEEDIKFLIEQASKFEEIQKSWWWLERRTHDSNTPMSVVRYFLHDIKKYFEPYKEDE